MDSLLKDFIVKLAFLTIFITIGSSRKEDFCEWETFNATCTGNEVIQIEHAHFGRMSLGRCAQRDYGYIGCHVDVLGYLDHLCSGRQSCQLRLPDENLDTGLQPCPNDLDSYIQLEYTCVPVCVSTKSCFGEPLPLAESKGLLANFITGITGQGSQDCPWEVRGFPGQRVRLTLQDYGVWSPPKSHGGGSGFRLPDSSSICHIYARITEVATGSSVTICGGDAKEKEVYLSETEVVHIVITDPKRTDNSAYFLIFYEIVGCPHYNPPEGTLYEQHGDELSLRCPSTGKTWHMSCDGTVWKAKGEIAICIETGSPSIGALLHNSLTLPRWMLMLIILAITVLIAVIIFFIGFISLRRHCATGAASTLDHTIGPEEYTNYPGYTAKEHHPMLAKNQRASQSLREREYTTRLHRHMAVPPGALTLLTPDRDFPPLPPTPFPNTENCPVHGIPNHDSYQRDSNHTTFKPTHPEHIYDWSKFLQRPRSEGDPSVPFYHELDPDQTDVCNGLPRERTDSDVEMNSVDTTVETPQ